jgi:1-aminocyclopropane-1-carboxylate deaminase/D-cysteine desulfhydrase-like pyridoxal-dependent ACC family enzyme
MATILDPFPRIRLASLPTPLEPLPRPSEFFGGPRILVKRDDQTGLALGGTKARKLEYLVEHACPLGCDALVTIGGLQSNHARQTAAAAGA